MRRWIVPLPWRSIQPLGCVHASHTGMFRAGGRTAPLVPPGAPAGLQSPDESSNSLAKPAAMASSDEHAAADHSDADESDVDEDWGDMP